MKINELASLRQFEGYVEYAIIYHRQHLVRFEDDISLVCVKPIIVVREEITDENIRHRN